MFITFDNIKYQRLSRRNFRISWYEQEYHSAPI